jgi:S-adenosyl methyltransferase
VVRIDTISTAISQLANACSGWKAGGPLKPRTDTAKPHSARMYDYYLGGKDHFAVDREVAEQAMRSWPAVRIAVRENRAFLGRAVRYLVKEAGVRQFLDIGTGLPSANNVHEVAQEVAPDCRVVYVDNDPLVLAHARALLTSSPAGKTAYIHADLREPEKILADPAVTGTLDFSQPIALMLVAVLHFVPPEAGPARIVSTMLDALPSGSYLTASHLTVEHSDPQEAAVAVGTYHRSGMPLQPRTADELAEVAFAGLEMVPPGVVLVSDWRPDAEGPRPLSAEVATYGGVARKA